MQKIVEVFLLNAELVLLATLLFFLLVCLYVLSARLRRIEKKHSDMFRASTGSTLEDVIMGSVDEIEDLKEQIKKLGSHCLFLEDVLLRRALKSPGLVRYNAFHDTGSELSFSLALLDDQCDGVVLTSIYGREESRSYAKPVDKGKSSCHLSAEEEAAIKKAAAASQELQKLKKNYVM